MELSRDFYVGIVEDNKDPNRKGRIKVRVQTLYHNLPLEDIPYAYPFAGLAGKEFQVPAIGKLVNILFLSDDLYSPYYIYSENYNENLQQKLKSLSDDEYADFTALLFDESTQIFVKGKEFTIDQLLNKVTINNTSINHELKDNEQFLNLGTKNATQDAVLGTRYFEWMDKFINELSRQGSLIDSAGAVVMKTKLDFLCKEYTMLRPNFVSNNVKIVDNGKVNILKRSPNTINNKNDVNLTVPEEENPEYSKALYDAIRAQNEKACETLKNSAPSDKVQLPQVLKDEKELEKIWNKGTRKQILSLHPEMQPYVTAFLNNCKAVGIKLKITDGYRDVATQQQYLNEGKPAAQPGYSYHNYGLAIDVAPENSNDWETIGQIGESLGFRWGKHFTTPKSERWHFDMGFGLSTSELKQRLENNDIINGHVNIGTPQITKVNQQHNGQDYIVADKATSINDPCDGCLAFNNLTSSEKSKKGENESAPNKEEENIANSTANLSCKEKAARVILDRIAAGEGTTEAMAKKNGFNSAYDITYGYGKYTPAYINGKNVNPITALTLGDIKETQKIMIKNGYNSPMGKYQIKYSTLKSIQRKLNLSDNVVFTPEIQDRMAMQLLIDERGYDRWLNGKLSDEKFQENLSKEWSSIANPKTGKSYYGQHVGTSDDQIKTALASIKNQMNNCS